MSLSNHTISIINHDPLKQLNFTKNTVADILETELRQKRGIKVNIILKINLEKEHRSQFPYFRSKARSIINTNEINEVIADSSHDLLNKIAEWISEGSGWVVKSIDKHEG